ncbi:hypothetical protein A1O3_08161 [Capronia epimyces CBS 606.96]|uniref:Uncharacterized protein n=1 Tax=Capronia epimyces CBS 606.96 TaxID=1182542 RepID=W9XSE2_9EURO|nr:uncharacterized protein A1O3_08161 [Capronia epimyces CBS 606.96]EXJ79876.1 hypothetical protein A1O3_08161 [Capronia epimyces CBS 606.96]
MPIKIVRALRQQPGVTTERFQEVWRQEVGPQVASLQTGLQLIKYVQIHRTPGAMDDSLRAMRPNLVQAEAPYDIVDEFHFDGVEADFLANYGSETGSRAWKALVQVGSQHLDLGRCQMRLVEERPFVLPGSPDSLVASEYNHVVRAVVFADAFTVDGDDGALTRSLEYWARSHAALTQRWAPSLGVLKYVQNYPYDGPVAEKLAEDGAGAWAWALPSSQRAQDQDQDQDQDQAQDQAPKAVGVDAPYKIHMYAAVWFSSRPPQPDDTAKRARLEIRRDEDSGFMRPNSMMCFVGKEHVFVDRYRA